MTSEREKANQISNNYLALKNAIKDPNYPSTAHTQAALEVEQSARALV